jgi:hypothetical protein
MSKEPKHLCKWDKDEIKDDLDKLRKLVDEPRFICRKCGRAAKDSDYLCKPVKL